MICSRPLELRLAGGRVMAQLIVFAVHHEQLLVLFAVRHE